MLFINLKDKKNFSLWSVRCSNRDLSQVDEHARVHRFSTVCTDKKAYTKAWIHDRFLTTFYVAKRIFLS